MKTVSILQSAIAKISQAKVRIRTLNAVNSNPQFYSDDNDNLPPHIQTLIDDSETRKAEDSLLTALESGNDSVYDQLINPETGLVFTESEKFDAVQKAIDREIAELKGQTNLSATDQARLNELIALSESVDQSHIQHTLSQAGVDISQYPDLIEDLGNPEAADAFAALFTGDTTIEQNTAQAILDGDLTIVNMDELRLDTGGIALVDFDGDGRFDEEFNTEEDPELFDLNGDGEISPSERFDRIIDVDADGNIVNIEPIQFIENPETGELLPIPIGAVGFNMPGSEDIWISTTDSFGNPLSEEEIAAILVHEANHALNPIDLNESSPVEFYESEFRAYWVDGTFDHLSGDEKAAAINEFILGSPTYSQIAESYNSDPDIAEQIDDITRPSGNLENS